MRLLACDDDSSFADFVATRQQRLLRIAQLLTGNQAAAEDLVQDALAKIWRRWSQTRVADDPDAYVRRVLVNTFVSAWRRKWRGEMPAGTTPFQRHPESRGPDLDVRLVVNAALKRLSRRERSVVVLRFVDDMSVAEVARVLDWPAGTVKSTTAKALAVLRSDPQLAELTEEPRNG